jgi:hypothetical protein
MNHRRVDDQFWESQKAALQAFDSKNPGVQYERPTAWLLAPPSALPATVPVAPPTPAQRRMSPVAPPVSPVLRTAPTPKEPLRPSRLEKGKQKRVIESDEEEEREETPRPAGGKSHPGKGNTKKAIESDEEEDREERPVPVSAGAKRELGKMRMPRDEPEERVIKVRPPPHQQEKKEKRRKVVESDEESEGSPAPKKRASPKSNGNLRTPGCKRCVKTRRNCYDQKGFAKACVACAKIKMKCESLSEDEESEDDPAPKKKPAVGGSKRPAPTSKPAPKKKPAREASPAPHPAPGASKKRKASPVLISSGSDEPTPRTRKRTFAELDKTDGKFHLI